MNPGSLPAQLYSHCSFLFIDDLGQVTWWRGWWKCQQGKSQSRLFALCRIYICVYISLYFSSCAVWSRGAFLTIYVRSVRGSSPSRNLANLDCVLPVFMCKFTVLRYLKLSSGGKSVAVDLNWELHQWPVRWLLGHATGISALLFRGLRTFEPHLMHCIFLLCVGGKVLIKFGTQLPRDKRILRSKECRKMVSSFIINLRHDVASFTFLIFITTLLLTLCSPRWLDIMIGIAEPWGYTDLRLFVGK